MAQIKRQPHHSLCQMCVSCQRVLAVLLFMTAIIVRAYPQPDSLFTEAEVKIDVAGGVLYGSLLIPDGMQSCPVALIIAGSGPTDRNGNNPFMVNNSLKLLAEGLAEKGIASLRYDKRGIGASRFPGLNESELRFEHFVDDARQWLSFLGQNPLFGAKVVIGHSEGSLIGMLAAGRADGFISLAGPGRPADELLKEQLRNQPKKIREYAGKVIDSLKQGYQIQHIDPLLFSLFRPSVQPYLISWFAYDPAQELAQLKIPCLIIQGSTDIQVQASDAERLGNALPGAKLHIIEGMNHVLKTWVGPPEGNAATYNDATLILSVGLIEAITGFFCDNHFLKDN